MNERIRERSTWNRIQLTGLAVFTSGGRSFERPGVQGSFDIAVHLSLVSLASFLLASSPFLCYYVNGNCIWWHFLIPVVRIYSCYGHGDLEFTTATSSDGAVASWGRSQTDYGEQGRGGYDEIHHRTRARGLSVGGLLVAEVQSLSWEKHVCCPLNPRACNKERSSHDTRKHLNSRLTCNCVSIQCNDKRIY